MYLKNGKPVSELNHIEKCLIIDGFVGNALQKYWDRETENGNEPDNCTLADAREVVNTYLTDCNFSVRFIRKTPQFQQPLG